MYNRLACFISRFHILFGHQFGFRSKHSTDLALIELVDSVTHALNNKICAACVFIDLSKAFDTIGHSILLSKLEHFGIRGVALQWFADYLNNRYQFTSIKGCDSDRLNIKHGVPQGSILGPLLFLFYINDLHYSSSILSFTLFADDTTIFYSSPQLSSLINTLNIELAQVSSWFKANKLSINHAKTNFIVFSKSYRPEDVDLPPVIIDGISITRVFSAKFLGIIIDHKLSWSEHISSVNKVICRNSGVISKIRHFLPASSLVLLYNTLIYPYLNYCNIVWASVSNTKMYSLFVSQKRAIRICTFSSPREHSAPLFAQLHTLSIADINKLHTGIFMYKFTHNLLPQVFSSFCTSV